ncbi:thioesterase II family protein [Pseudomonas sp. NPDC096950]|uniref:thioesterase II family protein n=1 Tax=Pseudomonas sp. NPDC096950 TaxID=3364485 RepID=UPI00383B42BF
MTVIDSEKVCIFIPFAGGSGLSFETLRRAVGTCMPVMGVTYKGRYQKNVTQAPDTVDAMANEVITLIDSLGAREVIIFGYSLGAIVAYEVARRQHEFAPRLTRLVVAACRAPQLFNCAQVTLDDSEDVFVQTVSKFGAIPDFMLKHSAAKNRMLPSLIKDFQAAALYRHVPGDQLGVPMLVLGGREDPFAPVQDVMAWREHSHNFVRLAFFEGNHFFLTQHIPAITQMITEADSPATFLSVSSPYLDTSVRI